MNQILTLACIFATAAVVLTGILLVEIRRRGDRATIGAIFGILLLCGLMAWGAGESAAQEMATRQG